MFFNEKERKTIKNDQIGLSKSEVKSKQFKYKILINQEHTPIDANNFGDYYSPIFFRPYELTIFDGCTLNTEKSDSFNPISTGVQSIQNTPESFTLAWLDERDLDRLSDPYPTFSIDYNSSKTLTFANIDFCSFMFKGKCLKCVDGYVQNDFKTACKKCSGFYNFFSNECESFDPRPLVSTQFVEAYTSPLINQSLQSENVVLLCPDYLTILDFYS